MFRPPTPKANEMVKASLAGAFSPSIIGDKKLLILVSILVVTFTVDSQIGYMADFIPEKLVANERIALFIGIAVVFAVGGILILQYVKTKTKESHVRALHPSRNPYWGDYCPICSDSNQCICYRPDTSNNTIQHLYTCYCSFY